MRYWAVTPWAVEQWAVSTEHRPQCKLQTVKVKPRPNHYRSSAECWSVAELNRAEAFGRIFGRCSALTELRCTSIPWKFLTLIFSIIYTMSKKTGLLWLVWHNFTNSQHLLNIFGTERLHNSIKSSVILIKISEIAGVQYS